MQPNKRNLPLLFAAILRKPCAHSIVWDWAPGVLPSSGITYPCPCVDACCDAFEHLRTRNLIHHRIKPQQLSVLDYTISRAARGRKACKDRAHRFVITRAILIKHIPHCCLNCSGHPMHCGSTCVSFIHPGALVGAPILLPHLQPGNLL